MLLKFRLLILITLLGAVAWAIWVYFEPIPTFSFHSKSGAETVANNPLKIKLTPKMIIKETMRGNAEMLVDEQEEAGDPLNNAGGKPSTKWETGWHEMYFPAKATIDLGGQYQLTAIYLFDTYDNGSATVSTGNPFQWEAQFTDKLESYHKWNAHPVNVKTRYIQITVSNHVAPVEVVIY